MSDYINSFRRCDVCGEYGYMETHRCHPCWYVANLDYGPSKDNESDWTRIFARDPQEAAERFAEYHDCRNAEFSEETNVVVLHLDQETMEFFAVEGRLDPVYTGTETTLEKMNAYLKELGYTHTLQVR
jgi:hypothetical protein